MGDKKKIILLCILFLAGLYFVYRLYYIGRSEDVTIKTADTAPKVEYVVGKLPVGLPENLPTENGVALIRNENITIAEGREVQGVRTYYSKKTVSDNFEIYKKYLKDNNWLILAEQKTKDFALLIAEKNGQDNFKISISKNSITGDVTVEINMATRVVE